MALEKDVLDAARERLEEELKTVESELTDMGFAQDGTVDVTFDEGFADAAQTTSERAKVLSLADGLKQRMEEVRSAIHRLDKGTYGICERCGNAISPERLEALPSASLCVSCKQKS